MLSTKWNVEVSIFMVSLESSIRYMSSVSQWVVLGRNGENFKVKRMLPFTRNTTFGAQPISIYSNQSNGLSSVSGTKSNIISWTERWLPSIIKCRNQMRRISNWQFHLCWKFHIHYYQIKHFIKMILIVAEIENMHQLIDKRLEVEMI